MQQVISGLFRASLALALAGCASSSFAATEAPVSAVQQLTYADVTSLTDAANIIARVEVKKQTQVETARAPGLAPGHARLYIEAKTEALIYGSGALAGTVTYLVDVPFNAKGKIPKLKKQRLLVFARAVPGNTARLQLVGSNSQFPTDPDLEARVRTVATELVATDSPPRITGIHDALWVPGNLAGESETQLFLQTSTGKPVTLSLIRRPGQNPQWGVSWDEVVDPSARPPQKNTLEWYRLACFLPSSLPARSVLSRDPQVRTQATRDYAEIVRDLGPCERTLPAPAQP